MKRAGLLLLIGCCLIVAACAAPEPEPPAQEETVAEVANDVVQKAVEIAKAIEADPDATEQILESQGLTVDLFEQMMYDISADPELSKAYEAALAE